MAGRASDDSDSEHSCLTMRGEREKEKHTQRAAKAIYPGFVTDWNANGNTFIFKSFSHSSRGDQAVLAHTTRVQPPPLSIGMGGLIYGIN